MVSEWRSRGGPWGSTRLEHVSTGYLHYLVTAFLKHTKMPGVVWDYKADLGYTCRMAMAQRASDAVRLIAECNPIVLVNGDACRLALPIDRVLSSDIIGGDFMISNTPSVLAMACCL